MDNFISGTAARRFRRKTAAASIRAPGQTVRTLQFGLDLSRVSGEIDFDAARRLCGVTEGIGKGSLAGLLFATHLSGFRLFSRAEDTKHHRERDVLKAEEFRAGFAAFAGEAGNISPAQVISVLTTRPRSVKGVAPAWSGKVADALYTLVRGKAVEADKAPNAVLVDAFTAVERELQAQFPVRASVADDPQTALRIFDAVLASTGAALPSVADVAASTAELTPAYSSIDIDTSLLTALPGASTDPHAVVAQKLRGRSLDADSLKDTTKAVQLDIVSATENGLSWLFGAGLQHWQGNTVEALCADYRTQDAARIASLKAWFDAIPADDFFCAEGFAVYRSAVGGKVTSWVANYVRRLGELQSVLDGASEGFTLPAALTDPASAELFEGSEVDLSAQGLGLALAGIPGALDDVRAALDVLCGRGDALPTAREVQVIEEFSETLDGIAAEIAKVANRINQRRKSKDASVVARASACQFVVPPWLRNLPRVPGLSGGVPDVVRTSREQAEKVNAARVGFREHVRSVLEWAESECVLLDPVAVLAVRESRTLALRPSVGDTPERQAKRKVLERLASLAARGSDDLRKGVRDLLTGIMHGKDANRRIFGDLGALYRSPFSDSRHAAYRMDAKALDALDVIDLLGCAAQVARDAFAADQSKGRFLDMLAVEWLAVSTTLAGLPERVPTAVASVDAIAAHCHIPARIRACLHGDTVGRETLISAFGLYATTVRAAVGTLFVETVVTSAGFSRVGANALHYCPRGGEWTPPATLYTTEAPIGSVMRALEAQTGSRVVVPQDAVPGILGAGVDVGSAPAQFLAQAQHNWCIDLGIKGLSAERPVLGAKVSKGIVARKAAPLSVPARLVGNSAYKTLLDDALAKGGVMVSDYRVLVTQPFRQCASFAADGTVSVEVEALPVTAALHIPLAEAGLEAPSEHPFARAVIGIDLGEAGIGFSVFRAEDIAAQGSAAEAVFAGAVAIRSVRNLIRAVERHRRHAQPMVKFGARADRALEKLRANVVGDICHVIDGLMARHRGFPVFESTIGNLASGGAQLRLVYDKVTNLYLHSDVDAHNAARAHHWAGGTKWEHPSLTRREKEGEGKGRKATGKPVPLKLAPGAGVHPAGTSQTCSCCRRNPIEMIRADAAKTFTVEAGGRVQLGTGEWLVLRSVDDPDATAAEKADAARVRRRQKLTAQPVFPVRAGRLTKEELERRVKAGMRHAPESSRSRDTTQSRYRCAFEDCGARGHADANAAINIVRKWVRAEGVGGKEAA